MSSLHAATRQFLMHGRQALAEACVDRQYANAPELQERYGEAGRAKCVQDTAFHLSYLASSVGTNSVELFADYVAWAKVVMNAYRVRTEDIVTNLVYLGRVLEERLPGESGALANEFLQVGLQRLPQMLTEGPTLIDSAAPQAGLARTYLEALLRGERRVASQLILDHVEAGLPIRDVYLHIFQPCQRELGRLWQLNRISVAQEHYCTAATQLVMSLLYPRLFATPKHGRRLVATCVGGELHEIGMRILTDFFELDGWDTFYLGANTPAGDVVKSVAQRGADLLAVSVTMTFHLPEVEQLIQAVRRSEVGSRVKVLVGGYPFNVVPDLWQKLGADGSAADAETAVALARTLLPRGDG